MKTLLYLVIINMLLISFSCEKEKTEIVTTYAIENRTSYKLDSIKLTFITNNIIDYSYTYYKLDTGQMTPFYETMSYEVSLTIFYGIVSAKIYKNYQFIQGINNMIQINQYIQIK